MSGKDTCNTLKQIRKTVAEQNGIPLETEECTYGGDCSGTCPKCEAELAALERALAEKEARGESVDRMADIEPPEDAKTADGGAEALRRSRTRNAAIRGKMLLNDMEEEPEMLEGDVLAPTLNGQILPPPEFSEPLEGEPAENYSDGSVWTPQSDTQEHENAFLNDMEGYIPAPKERTFWEKLRSFFRRRR